MRFTWLVIFSIIVVGGIAVRMNPSENTYATWLVTQESQRLHTQVAKGVVHLVGPLVVNQSTTVQNYGVCTVFTTDIFGQSVMVLGAFQTFVPLHIPSALSHSA